MRNREYNRTGQNPDFTPTAEADSTKGNRLGRLPILVGAGALTAAIAAGGYFATKSGESNPAPDRNRDPVATAPATPGETEVAEPTVEFGISAAEVNGDMKVFAAKYHEQYNALMISGATEEAATSTDRLTTPDDDVFVDEFSAPIDEEFFDNLYIEGWENNPDLVSHAESIKRVAHDTRVIRLATYSGGTDDIEPYVRETLIDDIAVDPYQKNKVSVRWHEQDNSDMNSGENYYDGGFDPNSLTGGSSFTTIVENGQVKISDVDYYEGY